MGADIQQKRPPKSGSWNITSRSTEQSIFRHPNLQCRRIFEMQWTRNITGAKSTFTTGRLTSLQSRSLSFHRFLVGYRMICSPTTSFDLTTSLLLETLRTCCRYSRSQRNCERRSEEHTSELQSRQYLVCRLLLAKKKEPARY